MCKLQFSFKCQSSEAGSMLMYLKPVCIVTSVALKFSIDHLKLILL